MTIVKTVSTCGHREVVLTSDIGLSVVSNPQTWLPTG